MIKSIDLTGNGVALRLHKPVLDNLSNISTKFIRLPDELKPNCKKPESDLIIIGTPVYKHVQHVLYAINHYEFVLCEKPMGCSLEQVIALKNTINSTDKTCFVNYQLRFLPILDKIFEFSKKNIVKSVTISYRSNARINKKLPGWYLDYRVGGGVLYSLLSHIIDLLNYLGFNISSGFRFEFDKSKFQVPMNEVDIYGVTTQGTVLNISIDTKQNYDQFVIELFGNGNIKKFDLIGNCESNKNCIYKNGALSSQNVSPWRIGFRLLMLELLSPMKKTEIATINDAISVHYILSEIISRCNA